MKRPPPTFTKSAYVDWHNTTHPEDSDLVERLTAFMHEARTRSGPPLRLLGQILSQIAEHTEREVNVANADLLPLRFRLPTEQITGKALVKWPLTPEQMAARYLGKQSFPPNFVLSPRPVAQPSPKSGSSAQRLPDESLFKPLDSILEKMWRINRGRSGDDEPDVTMGTLASEISDLVRMSVVAPTLLHARQYVRRLEQWRRYVQKVETPDSAPLADLNALRIDHEAKLARGYFAFHVNASFAGDLNVEVQVFSDLTSAWRAISHRLYERSRIGGEIDARPGTRDARLASLGHLLHLADCEIERLAQEFASEPKIG